MKNKKSTIILLALFFIGLSVMLYPSLANYWNSKTQSEAIVDYESMLENTPQADFSAYFSVAEDYNRRLNALPDPLGRYDAVDGYHDALNLSGTGMMGYLKVEKIGQELPIYHGTSHEVLSSAVGHLQGSSLPIGGESTHCVVSAHRGLPTAELFTHLDRMEVGDTFQLVILDRTLTYQVDQIRIVNPDNTDFITAENGKDLCTLLTCTPYGINTQRLLVRGHRIEPDQQAIIHIASQAYRVDTLIVMPIVALPMLAVLMLWVIFSPVKKISSKEDAV